MSHDHDMIRQALSPEATAQRADTSKLSPDLIEKQRRHNEACVRAIFGGDIQCDPAAAVQYLYQMYTEHDNTAETVDASVFGDVWKRREIVKSGR